MKIKIFITALLTLNLITVAQAEVVFGRFYTTPNQRDQLDQARINQPEQIRIDLPEQQTVEPAVETGPPANSSIMLNGIVHRSDGKNTAWINRNSTNQGSVETQYTRVDEKDVGSNEVTIRLPGNGDRVPMKVGQEYDVNSKQIHDHMKDPIPFSDAAVDGTRPSR